MYYLILILLIVSGFWCTGGKLSPARLSSHAKNADASDEDEVDHHDTPSQNIDDRADDGYVGLEDWTAMFARV